MLQKKVARQNDQIAHLKDELSITRNKANKERKSYEEALKKAADRISAAEKKMHVALCAIFLVGVVDVVVLWFVYYH